MRTFTCRSTFLYDQTHAPNPQPHVNSNITIFSSPFSWKSKNNMDKYTGNEILWENRFATYVRKNFSEK